jgi:LPS O-antigen subunit length determinant protein (WzzB/FepE family)
MKKNTPLYDHEIDLMDYVKTIWDGKIKILLITIISFLLGFGYNSQIPNNYLNSLSVNPSKDYKILMVENLKKLVKSNQSNQSIKSIKSIQKQFIDELKDYEEFILNIKNIKKVQEHVSKFKIEDQQIEFYKYVQSLEIVESKKNEGKYIINFKWHDPDEAKKILKDTLNLVSKNLKKLIELEILQLLEFEKKSLLYRDIERLDYLKEQSTIAKELNITDNQIDNVNLTQSSVSLSINTADIAYYLRGYKAIDKEIELIKNRKRFKYIDKEINEFKDAEINLVNYNIYLMESKSLKNTRLILMKSILLGLLAGVLYVHISNTIQSQKISKKIK